MATSDIPDVKHGDWVRFYQGGTLVIGVVQYVRKSKTYPYEWIAITDVGMVCCDHIEDVRR